MLHPRFSLSSDPLARKITEYYRREEASVVQELLEAWDMPSEVKLRIQGRAIKLVEGLRKERLKRKGVEAFLFEYDLSSEEGIALMCLAEALLRIPDAKTRDLFIKDKVTQAQWEKHFGKSHSTFVNAATWGLMLTGKIVQDAPSTNRLTGLLKGWFTRSSEVVIRQAMAKGMAYLGDQFVMGQTITEAIKRAKAYEGRGYRFSYDMLGEAALTQEDADHYFQAYQRAIYEIAQVAVNSGPVESPGISIKLSALHPRYEVFQEERVFNELLPKVRVLAQQAMQANIHLTIDAEESERLELSLGIIEAIMTDPICEHWTGFGLALQAYQKRALPVLDWLIAKARASHRRIMVRLVKGAYWDSEIKRSQEQGLVDYPVFTRKANTDLSYVLCAQKMLDAPDVIFPQFATHNAQTVATLIELCGNKPFEFQCLHGMGDTLYDNIVGEKNFNLPCRVYAPVGTHKDLLAYLVRRLLENGANTSFINQIMDVQRPVEQLVQDPYEIILNTVGARHPNIPLPRDLFGATRVNAAGVDFSNPLYMEPLLAKLGQHFSAAPTVVSTVPHPEADRLRPVMMPAEKNKMIAEVCQVTESELRIILDQAAKAFPSWEAKGVKERAALLNRTADLMEENQDRLLALLMQEAGKILVDAVSELREAVDFCRYYAVSAEENLATLVLPGPTGEENTFSYRGRGVALCISPWNFPLAIFMGQVAAALVTGNTVLAKSATQTPLIAAAAIDLLHQAGIPKDVVQWVCASGRVVQEVLVKDPRVQVVIFTGSTDTAWMLQSTLAARRGAIVPLIAETGGQNVMLVDSSALPEQVVQDVVTSAFRSVGQRCSALRILCVQEEIAERVIKMLVGAMAELKVGDPRNLTTDIGPVIDQSQLEALQTHRAFLDQKATFLGAVPLDPLVAQQGHFFAPCAYQIDSLELLTTEIFGPILHVYSYKKAEFGELLQRVNQLGYGLTMGVHSRIKETIDYVQEQAHVGNLYVNRSMIGAVVGVQPFGGEGLSGTGPKAGGPNYLKRLVHERVVSVNTTAAGGNASLICLEG